MEHRTNKERREGVDESQGVERSCMMQPSSSKLTVTVEATFPPTEVMVEPTPAAPDCNRIRMIQYRHIFLVSSWSVCSNYLDET